MTTSWARIVELHRDTWVCLLDIALQPDGAIDSARVVEHAPTAEQALDLAESFGPDIAVVHTADRPWWTPRWLPGSDG